MNEKKFIINFEPVPQPRPRVTRFGTFDPAKEKKTFVKLLLIEQMDEPLKYPIEMEIIFFMPIPKSTSIKKAKEMLTGKIKHTKKPDIDNLYKFFTDAMNKIIYDDDSQVYKVYMEKRYSDKPRTEIFIRW